MALPRARAVGKRPRRAPAERTRGAPIMTMFDTLRCEAHDAAVIGCWASECLKLEVATYPKPGLVSHVDSGAHRDMDAALINASAETLEAYFADLAEAGAAGAPMGR